jgi:hypothetical protein
MTAIRAARGRGKRPKTTRAKVLVETGLIRKIGHDFVGNVWVSLDFVTA